MYLEKIADIENLHKLKKDIDLAFKNTCRINMSLAKEYNMLLYKILEFDYKRSVI